MYKIKIKKGWWPWKRQQLAVKALDFAIKHYELQNECAIYPVKLILTKFKDNYYGAVSYTHLTLPTICSV